MVPMEALEYIRYVLGDQINLSRVMYDVIYVNLNDFPMWSPKVIWVAHPKVDKTFFNP